MKTVCEHCWHDVTGNLNFVFPGDTVPAGKRNESCCKCTETRLISPKFSHQQYTDWLDTRSWDGG